jgi:co-chaperonin GroES (HSP10)
MDGGIRPLGDRIAVQRTEGHGVEKVLASGIVLPATREATVQTKGDYFRARVTAMGNEAARKLPDLAVGNDVFVYAYSGNGETVFTGEDGGSALFIRPDDVLCVVEGE